MYCPYQYITQEDDNSIDDSLAALKFIPAWFITIKVIKNIFNEDSSDDVFIMKWALLILILKRLILIIILVKMILILFFVTDFKLGILNLKYAKNLKNR